MTQICSSKYPVLPHILGDMLDLANNKIITSCVVWLETGVSVSLYSSSNSPFLQRVDFTQCFLFESRFLTKFNVLQRATWYFVLTKSEEYNIKTRWWSKRRCESKCISYEL